MSTQTMTEHPWIHSPQSKRFTILCSCLMKLSNITG
uniref:Uncharacterized protein n=1 Tax=Zea mays TaxID=4577 RepID=B8A3F2_MAIZE|nr:unknown [Zea mays]